MELVATFALLVVILIMATLGAVLLALFLRPRSGTASRTIWAASAGPLLVSAPTALFIVGNGEDLIIGLLAIAFMSGGGALVVGWPVSHFATRRLDKLTQFDVSTFE